MIGAVYKDCSSLVLNVVFLMGKLSYSLINITILELIKFPTSKEF